MAKQPTWQRWLREAFLFLLGAAILYDQVLVAHEAQMVLIVLVLFLWGCIPALRGDAKPGKLGPFARIVMLLMGIPAESLEAYSESQRDGQTRSGGASRQPPSSD